MNKTLYLRDDLQKKFELTKSIFSDEDLKKTIIEVLIGYDHLLNYFMALFLELNQEKWANSISSLLLEHEYIFEGFYDLKNRISNINNNEIDKKIAEEFKLL